MHCGTLRSHFDRIPGFTTTLRNSVAQCVTADRGQQRNTSSPSGRKNFGTSLCCPEVSLKHPAENVTRKRMFLMPQFSMKGRKLVRESNCVGCHKIDGYQKQWDPSLDGIGSKVNRTWLVHWLKNPKQYYPQTKNAEFPVER